jgi:hypothetical protein
MCTSNVQIVLTPPFNLVVTIPSGETSSGLVEIPDGKLIVGFTIPANFTGTSLAIHGSTDRGLTSGPIYSDGSPVSATMPDNNAVRILPIWPPGALAILTHIKLVAAQQSESVNIMVGLR